MSNRKDEQEGVPVAIDMGDDVAIPAVAERRPTAHQR
jgi:hypothetical protein